MRPSQTLRCRAALAFLLVAYSTVSVASERRSPLELSWFNDVNSKVEALTTRPTECVKPVDDIRFKLGRVAFNSPRLLGGQAGRMGLSCASCHPSARANTQFFIKQISDQVGYADISHHFLSSRGGDGVFNPKPIPDLAEIESLRFKDRNGRPFEALLTQLIEIEFDGQRPASDVFDALKLYLSQNSIEHCRSPVKNVVRNLKSEWTLIEDGMAVLESGEFTGKPQTTKFVSASMRATLETLYRFYSISPVTSLERQLIDVSRALNGLAGGITVVNEIQTLNLIRTSLDKLEEELQAYESTSFYNRQSASEFLNLVE